VLIAVAELLVYVLSACMLNRKCNIAGDLVDQRTEAIVNPTNILLQHDGGAAKTIGDTAGRDLKDECRDYIKRHGQLKVAEPMHTTAGDLPLPVICVIHVAGPDSAQYRDKEQCYQHLKCAFRNCLQYANEVVEVHSVSIPAISSGEWVHCPVP